MEHQRLLPSSMEPKPRWFGKEQSQMEIQAGKEIKMVLVMRVVLKGVMRFKRSHPMSLLSQVQSPLD